MGRCHLAFGELSGEKDAHLDRHDPGESPEPTKAEAPSTSAESQVKVDTFPQPLVVLAAYEHLWLRVKAGLPGTRTSSTSRHDVSTSLSTVIAAVTLSSRSSSEPNRIAPPSTSSASSSVETEATRPGIRSAAATATASASRAVASSRSPP